MTLFKNKYRIESARLPDWDYGQAGFYYLTICAKDRAHFFGDVVAADVILSQIGQIVAEEWLKTETLRPNIKLDEWIIMPNHMHMIVVITFKMETAVETLGPGVSDNQKPQRDGSTPQQRQTMAASEKWAANTLGSIIGQFKGKCTKRIWAQGFNDFAWQPRFYDRIIWSEDALHKARHYIASNPTNWEKDRDNVTGLYM